MTILEWVAISFSRGSFMEVAVSISCALKSPLHQWEADELTSGFFQRVLTEPANSLRWEFLVGQIQYFPIRNRLLFTLHGL